jgi:serine/threonine protein kinase
MHNPQFLKRFVDEARITGQLEHPNIIPVHDLGVVDRRKLFFSMKYIEGEELGAILRKLRRDDPDTVAKYTLYALLTIFRKVCDAVAFAHSKGILHRDIKPDNIMVARYGEVMLVDWGLARYEEDRDPEVTPGEEDLITAMSDTSSLKTRDGMIKGTPAYMAPEQARGEPHAIGPWTDVYAMGAVIFRCITGRYPFAGETFLGTVQKISSEDAPPITTYRPDAPPELDQIVRACMFRDARARPTAAQLADEISRLLARGPLIMPPAPPCELV